MTIHQSANPANVARSIHKFLVDGIVGATGFPGKFAKENVWWPGRKINTEAMDYFLRVNQAEVLRDYFAAAAADVPGYRVVELLTLEVWAKRRVYDANPYILDQAMATIRGLMYRGTAIPIRDYDDGGSTIYAYSIVETMRPRPGPEDAVWRSSVIEFDLVRHERDTTT